MIVGTLSAGTGAFETMRVYRGTPFAWRRHTERLAAAVRALGLVPPDPAGLREAVAAVLRANGLVDARLRVTVIAAPDADADPDIVVAASAVVPPRPHASVVIAPWPRNERAITVGLKSTSYAENVRASADARDLGADEAVFANTRAELCEATGSNVFVVEGGIVRTPPASAGCLLGVTRQLVLEVGARDGIRVEEVARPISALAAADEAFLTSTTREVQGIASVDGRMLPSAPGPVTARLAARFSDLVARDLDP